MASFKLIADKNLNSITIFSELAQRSNPVVLLVLLVLLAFFDVDEKNLVINKII